MKILQDGTVEITNKRTGQTKIVKPEDLPNYGIPYSGFQKELESFKAVGGDTVLGSPQSTKERDAKTVKTELQDRAQALLDTLDQGKSGKLTGQAYKDALNFASSQYAAAKGFGEGGKALTAPELTTLGGQIPVIKQHGQSFIDKFTGNIPTQRGEVTDPEDTLRRKAMIALAVAQGKEVDPALLQQTEQNTGGFLSGDIQTVKDILSAGRELPKQGGLLGMILKNPGQFVEQTAQGIGKDVDQAVQDPIGTLYRNPINSALNVTGVGSLLKNILKKGATTAAKTALESTGKTTGEAVLQNPNLLQKVLGVPETVGKNLRAGVRQIDTGPSIYGPQQEAKIIQTLDNLGIKGSPSEQYAQLQPKMAQLGDQIQATLEKNPKSVSMKQVENDFMVNLSDQLRSKNLTAPAAKKEIRGYLSDLYGDKINSETISTPELFKLKQKINQDYKSVQKKIDAGSSLNDREKVISASRQTLDDIIAEAHPDVKQTTSAQSNLYDAAESLYKARGKKPALNLFGQRIPIPFGSQIQGGQDLMGRILQSGRP